ncbi:MAG TPA: insulinase family protein, partial [Patescibacteria group bacterium]|nr:insulinase family protein [Patescibacteria group bacterium]
LSYHTDGFLKDSIHIADILATLLGDGRSSRLYQSLIYDKQIASSVGAFVDKREGSSLFTLYAIAADEDVSRETLRHALEKEIAEIQNELTHDREVLKAKNTIATQFANELQTAHGIGDILASQTLFWNRPERINEILGKYEQVTAAKIKEYAIETFKKENSVCVGVVPRVRSEETID